MSTYRPRFAKPDTGYYAGKRANTLARPIPANLKRNFKNIGILVFVVLLTNILSHTYYNPGVAPDDIAPVLETPIGDDGPQLYLMDKASQFVPDEKSFEDKVREIAEMLGVAPEWLMAVMYSESKFDAQVLNHKGSGATGLIQFMPGAANDMNVSLQRLRKMSHLQQLEYVYLYLEKVRERYGDYDSLTDLYLGILYPKARKQDFCYALYAKPTKSYRQNSGLDENKDGIVTVSDIDLRMKRLYPTAYMAEKGTTGFYN